MGKVVKFEYGEVKEFRKNLRTQASARNVDTMFRKICDVAMENTISAVETHPKHPEQDGDLKRGWRNDIKKARKSKNVYSKTATNKASNKLAKEFGLTEFYALYVEEGNKNPAPYYEDERGVHWITRPEGVHMLRDAENDTLNKLQGIVDEEVKKLFGGLFV